MSTSSPNQQPMDAAQLLAVANGDRVAFSELYDRYANPVFALALAILKNQAEAEDLLQEIMVKVWTKASSYNSRQGSPLTWIMALTRNGAIDRLRKGKKATDLEKPLLDDDSLESDIHNAHQSAAQNETRKIVKTSLLILPLEQRQAIELAYFGGLTHTEIAFNLGVPVGTIKARIRRGMQKLYGELKDVL